MTALSEPGLLSPSSARLEGPCGVFMSITVEPSMFIHPSLHLLFPGPLGAKTAC